MPRARVTERMQVASPPAPAPVTITFRLHEQGGDGQDNGSGHVRADGAVWVPDAVPAGQGDGASP